MDDDDQEIYEQEEEQNEEKKKGWRRFIPKCCKCEKQKVKRWLLISLIIGYVALNLSIAGVHIYWLTRKRNLVQVDLRIINFVYNTSVSPFAIFACCVGAVAALLRVKTMLLLHACVISLCIFCMVQGYAFEHVGPDDTAVQLKYLKLKQTAVINVLKAYGPVVVMEILAVLLDPVILLVVYCRERNEKHPYCWC